MDRRKVLIAVAVVALLADLAFVLLMPKGRKLNLVLAGVFGAAIFAMFPIIVAHANDHAPEGTSIQVSGGLSMVYGFGSIIGPFAAGTAMTEIGPRGLSLTTVVAHVLMIGFTRWRLSVRNAMPQAEKGAFQVTLPARVATPKTFALAKGESEARELNLEEVGPPSEAIATDPPHPEEDSTAEARRDA